jgi:hypothetical protein
MSAQAAHNDYQDLQINGVRVETYGKPSAAPPVVVCPRRMSGQARM